MYICGFTRCNLTVYTQYAGNKDGKDVLVRKQLMKYTKNWTKNRKTWWIVYLITTLNICRFRRKFDHLAFRSAPNCTEITKNTDKNRNWAKSLVLRFWTSSKETVIQPETKTAKYLFIGLHVRSTLLVWAPVKGHTKLCLWTTIKCLQPSGLRKLYPFHASVVIWIPALQK